MRIQDLAGVARDTTYIVGTGPSMRCFPLDFLKDKFTIGLNQAYKHFTPVFSITVHPELLVEWSAGKCCETQWLVKRKAPMENLKLDDKDFYVFHTSPDLDTVSRRPKDTLYIGEGVQCTAMDLAARMGARTLILVGCDATSLHGDHHGHDQHVRFLGQKPEDQYRLYRKRTAQTRKVLRDSFGVQTLSLTPFIGSGHADEDYARLVKELALPALPSPKDTSTYTRTTPGD